MSLNWDDYVNNEAS